jgi:hypothetical protein
MMLAFPHIIVDSSGDYDLRDGALFSLPPELIDSYRVTQYLKIKSDGWSISEFGYMTLVKYDGIGQRYVIPGLYLSDARAPTKKISGYRPIFSKVDVESYVSKHLAWEDSVRKKSEDELTSLVHDLRHLSGSIYHSALEVENALKARDWQKSQESIKTVIASQTMLRVRIDYLDFSNSVDRFDDSEDIPVFSRVDKVIRCFRAAAKNKRIDIFLTGESYRLAKGPNILDIVPYTIIENAIKYAPSGSNIDVSVTDEGDETVVEIQSLGPKLDPGEPERIFMRGFRGANAIRFRANGTGLGLSVARTVIDLFGGSIKVLQDGTTSFRDGVPHIKTRFSFKLPTFGEDSYRKRKFSRARERRVLRGETR